jgi:hypothetical protein
MASSEFGHVVQILRNIRFPVGIFSNLHLVY